MSQTWTLIAALALVSLAGFACASRAPAQCVVEPPATSTSDMRPGPPRFGGASGQPAHLEGDARREAEMLGLVNADRAEHGLPPLEQDPALTYVARRHAFDMADLQFVGHDSPRTGSFADRLDRIGYLRRMARENAARSETTERGQANFMASPSHRNNVLADDVTHAGIGIVERNFMLYIVQAFAEPAELEPAEELEAAVEAKLQHERRTLALPQLPRSAILQAVAEREAAHLDAGFSEEHADAITSRALRAVQCDADPRVRSIAGLALRSARHRGEVTIPSAAFDPQTAAFGLSVREAERADGSPVALVVLLFGGR